VLFYPIAVLIHELGHAFFVKLFGEKIISIGFGTGEKIVQIKKFYVAKDSILFGKIRWDRSSELNVYQSFFLYFGGILFNILTGTILWIFGDVTYAYIYKPFIFLSYYMALFNLVPFKFRDGRDSDGLLILKLFKSRFKEC
jgi:Zn-dependent protease